MSTFELLTVAGTPAIRCLLCGRTSELPGDVEHQYCSRCHLFHEHVEAARTLHRVFGHMAHECEEWRTFRNRCAICERSLEEPMKSATETELVERMATELQQTAMLHLAMTPVQAFQLVGVLQLALRHPKFTGSSRHAAEWFIEHARAHFAGCPAVLEVIYRGDNPVNDQPF